MTTPSSPSPTEAPHCQQLVRKLLGQTVTCTLDDGRTAKGILICIDRLKNMILSQVVEERMVDASVYSSDENVPTKIVTTSRFLSQAMIPGDHLVKVEIARSIHEKIAISSAQ